MARITIVFITVLDLIPKQTKINAKLQNFNFKPEIFIFEFSRKQPLYKLPFYEIYFCAFPSKIKISVKNLNFEFFGNKPIILMANFRKITKIIQRVNS